MLKNEKTNFNGNLYKSKSSISSQIENEAIEKNNNIKKVINHQRKNISSLFIGSYLLDKEHNIFIQKNNGNNNNENKKIKNISYDNNENQNSNLKDLKSSLLKERNRNSSNTNVNTNDNDKCFPPTNSSFYSYSIENEDNMEQINDNAIIENEKSLNNSYQTKYSEFIYSNNPYNEFEKYKEKSFLQIKNILKYLKDKDERITDSYLMALDLEGTGDINLKNQYLPTVSVIEEEKSEFIDTTSKKRPNINNNFLLINKDLKKKNIKNEFRKNLKNDYKENIDIKDNILFLKSPKIKFDLNKIIIKDSYKDEIKKNNLKKNKTNINSFNKNNSNFPNNKKLVNKKINIFSNIRKSSYNKSIDKKDNKNIIIKTPRKFKIYSPISSSLINKKINNNNKNYSSCLYHQKSNTNNNNYSSCLYHQKCNTNNIQKKNIINSSYNISSLINKKYNNFIHQNINKNRLNKSVNNSLITKYKIKSKNSQNKIIKNKKSEINIIFNQNYNLKKSLFNKQNNTEVKVLFKKSINNSKNNIKKKYNYKNNILSVNKIEKIFYNKELLIDYDIKKENDIIYKTEILNKHKKICKVPDSNSSRIKQKIKKIIKTNKNT